MTREAATVNEEPEDPAFRVRGDGEADTEREVMKAIFEASGKPDPSKAYCPQAVGEDAPRKTAGVDSPTYWNATQVKQTVYRRGSQTPIVLLPGDCVVGREFRRFCKMSGGPLTEERPTEIVAKSKADKAFFDVRGMLKGPIADRARRVKSPHGTVIRPPR